MVKGKPQALDCVSGLKGIIDKVLENCSPIAQKQACQLTFHDESQGNIQANVPALVSAINNVLINSIEAGASQISLHAYDDDSHIVVKIVDNGAGLMQSDLVSTSSFFTTKSQGTGLGLSVVQSVMRQHNGALSLCNRQVKGQTEKGCIVLLRFPKIRTSVEASTVEYSHG
ncbi:sensor histidine kinase [Shewanella surugensis]|uniref:histidine kinase n=1 Tax=Shewanella surugensis TaxID=212020 RepID=A0ABT0LCN1_9GAMM|nr:HAMP domain-containing histidine kinase [Shewanella surugensis]